VAANVSAAVLQHLKSACIRHGCERQKVEAEKEALSDNQRRHVKLGQALNDWACTPAAASGCSSDQR
jgi:hypothetical protein